MVLLVSTHTQTHTHSQTERESYTWMDFRAFAGIQLAIAKLHGTDILQIPTYHWIMEETERMKNLHCQKVLPFSIATSLAGFYIRDSVIIHLKFVVHG